jgi:signal transduction histidine kinase
MTAAQLIQYLSWALFVLVCLRVTVTAIREPRRATIDIALLFIVPCAIISIDVAAVLGLLPGGPILNAINTALILVMIYMLLRLVDDFSNVPWWLMRGAELALALLVIGAFLFAAAQPAWLTIAMLLFLVGLLLYAVIAFMRESRRSSGVTRRRMLAVALGSLLLVLLFVIASLNLILPAQTSLWEILADTAGLAAGGSYFLGFAPPGWLRRAWQEPDLRAFLGRAAALPRLPDTQAILNELERGAATSLGAPSARIGLWDADAQRIHFPLGDPSYALDPNEPVPAARAFRTQRPTFAINVPREYPEYAEMSRKYGLTAMLAAPITAGDKRLGVLVLYAPRAPIFADDDLALVQLLADQAAVILESRALIDEATHVRAREEATRLREDFLSAAAHDLKTPLTTLIGKAQLMERLAVRNPSAPADLAGLRTLVSQGQRLKQIVLELLDAARAEQGRLVGDRSPTDLVELASEVCSRHHTQRHPCVVESSGPVIGMYDSFRMAQLLENLVENAIKYSPDGGEVRVKVWAEGGHAYLTVTDQGIGIPTRDLAHVFDRFYRAANVDDRQFAGMGLGLFICRGIAEQHGGRMLVRSRPDQGSTFQVELPLMPVGEMVHA